MRPSLRISSLAACLLAASLASSALAQASAASADAHGLAWAAPASATPEVIGYDRGAVTIEQPSQADLNPAFIEMPVRVQGILAVPEGEGPFPVALVMHGSYPFCTAMAKADDPPPYPCPAEDDLRQYEGFGELASVLAARGYLAIVPDLAPEYAEGFGWAPFGERAIQIADAHLDALAEGSGFPVDVAGKADLERLVLIGHSRGGSLIVRYATDESAKRTPRALALLTPAYLAPESIIPETMPAALVISQCDGDVGPQQPLMFLENQLPPTRPAPTLIYTIPGGTHNAFSTKLEREQGPECKVSELMAPEQQRAIIAALLPGFFDMALAVQGR